MPLPLKLLVPRYNFLRRDYWWGLVDTRPLSVFRIGFALLLLKDALYHLPLAHVFYSDAGVLPRSALWAGLARANRFSLMDALPYDWMAVAFFLIWAMVTVGLAVGWRTRLLSVLNFVLVLSLQERNLYVITGADNVIRVLCFWMMFLPLGDYFSLDAVRTRWTRYARTRTLADLRPPERPRTGWAFPLRVIQIQFALVYLCTGLDKYSGIWLRGEALHYVFQLKSLTLPTGDWLFAHMPGWVLQVMSYQALVTEVAFFILMFLPLGQPWLRALGLALGTLLHLGILVTMSIPDFSLVMMIGYLLFLEPEWIERAERKLRAATTSSVVASPPAGNPLWVILALTPASAVAVKRSVGRAGDGPDDWKVKPQGGRQLLSGAKAWRRLAGHLPLSRLWSFKFRWVWVRRLCWRILRGVVERNAIPPPEAAALEGEAAARPANHLGRVVAAAALTTLLAGVLWWNAADLDPTGKPIAPPVSEPFRSMIQFSGLWQQWNMFSPYPLQDDGWLLAPGKFEDGVTVNLLTGQPVSDVMQRWLFGPDERWKKYVENVRLQVNPQLLKPFGDYFCREHDVVQARSPGTRLATLELHFRHRASYPPGGREQPWQDQLLWKQGCYPGYQY